MSLLLLILHPLCQAVSEMKSGPDANKCAHVLAESVCVFRKERGEISGGFNALTTSEGDQGQGCHWPFPLELMWAITASDLLRYMKGALDNQEQSRETVAKLLFSASGLLFRGCLIRTRSQGQSGHVGLDVEADMEAKAPESDSSKPSWHL